MRFVIQRVLGAEVDINGTEKRSIGKGYVVLIGVCNEDDNVITEKMVRKLINMRIFEDENGKTNLSLNDVDGELMLISQFTLYADCKKGNRPSFIKAGDPGYAEQVYQSIISLCKGHVKNVVTGEFGADMKISLINDGPFTIFLDSDSIF